MLVRLSERDLFRQEDGDSNKPISNNDGNENVKETSLDEQNNSFARTSH